MDGGNRPVLRVVEQNCRAVRTVGGQGHIRFVRHKTVPLPGRAAEMAVPVRLSHPLHDRGMDLPGNHNVLRRKTNRRAQPAEILQDILLPVAPPPAQIQAGEIPLGDAAEAGRKAVRRVDPV